MLSQIKPGQSHHLGTQPTTTLSSPEFPKRIQATPLSQPSITANPSRSWRHGIHVHTPKISRARLVCLGNKALATRTACFTFFWFKAFLACLVISFLRTSSALRLIPRVNPAFNPLLILLGNFKGFRVLLRPWNPPRMTSLINPLPYWSYHSSVRNRVKLPPRMVSSSPGIHVLFGSQASPLFIPSSAFLFLPSGRCFHGFLTTVTRGTTHRSQRGGFPHSY